MQLKEHGQIPQELADHFPESICICGDKGIAYRPYLLGVTFQPLYWAGCNVSFLFKFLLK
jgi:hypothetical protein